MSSKPPTRGAELPFVPSPPLIIEREDGQYQIGWNDDADGPFPSRGFAEAVARKHRMDISQLRR